MSPEVNSCTITAHERLGGMDVGLNVSTLLAADKIYTHWHEETTLIEQAATSDSLCVAII